MELTLTKNRVIENNLEREQKKFLDTRFGKIINTGLDIGLRTVLPDLIEDEVISVKNAILENGFKLRIRNSNFIFYKFRKKCYRYTYWKF